MRKSAVIIAFFIGILAVCYSLAQRKYRLPAEINEPAFAQARQDIAANKEPAQPRPAGPVPLRVSAAVFPAEPTTVQHVFRLQLDRGKCSLEAVEEVRGAFGRERVPQWEMGMLCCRLIAQDGRVIGERTIHAPDHVCFVLDPNVDAAAPPVARLTADGPSVFQVRFSEIADAARLEVHRIERAQKPGDTSTAIGPLLGSIAIPGK